MPKFRAALGITVVLFFGLAVAGCEDDTTDDPPPQQEQQEQQEQQQDNADSEDQEPRAAETEIPDDSDIGELPDGIGIATGESAPEVSTTDTDGNDVELLELIDDEAIVLFFYRGGWCPYCNFQIREMTQAGDQFFDRGVRPVAISVDRPDEASQTAGGYDIPFPVLTDPDLTVHEAFSVVYEADAQEVQELAEMGMDIEEASGRDHNSYAVPSIFIIDNDGVVRWSHANLDYSVRPSTDQLLTVIDDLWDDE